MTADDMEAAYLKAAVLDAPDAFLSDLRKIMYRKAWGLDHDPEFDKFSDEPAYLDNLISTIKKPSKRPYGARTSF